MPQREKPPKPSKDFPLTPHATKRWCKKIRGKIYYFGTWDNPDSALQESLKIKEELQAGIDPRRSVTRVTTEDLVNAFLHRSDSRVKSGELSALSWNDYRVIGKMIVNHLGQTTDPEKLRPVDFASFRQSVAEKYSPSRISKVVTVTRQIFKWAQNSELIGTLPRFGPDFSVSTRNQMLLHRAVQEKKLLTDEEIRKLLASGSQKWKAILLLCINGGLGNSDIARLTLSDVSGEWLELPRGKTGVDRRIPLWSETSNAIERYLKSRMEPQAGVKELLFLSERGGPMVSIQEGGHRADLVAKGFRKLAVLTDVYRPRLGLYWFRHTFQTIGDGAGDPMATSHMMGHIDGSMAGQSEEQIDDSRLLKVANHVHNWLFKTTRKKEAE